MEITQQMQLCQDRLANVLELAYLHANKHPPTAEKVRLTAHRARFEQLLSRRAMKSVRLIAEHIHDTMLLIILEGINAKDGDLLSEAIGLTCEMILDTKKEIEELSVRSRKCMVQFQTMVTSLEEESRINPIGIEELFKKSDQHCKDNITTLFWENLIKVLQILNMTCETSMLFDELRTESDIEIFREICAGAEREWKHVSLICQDYERSQTNLDATYDFLFTHYDSLTGTKIEDRKNALMQNINLINRTILEILN